MAPAPTTHQVLAEMCLGTPLASWITARRERGDSWRHMADELYTASNQRVHLAPETLRQWYLSLEGS